MSVIVVGVNHRTVPLELLERLAVPAAAAQGVADQLVAAGVRAILNFAPVMVSVPDDVSLRKVDLAVELQILSFYQQQRGVGGGKEAASAD